MLFLEVVFGHFSPPLGLEPEKELTAKNAKDAKPFILASVDIDGIDQKSLLRQST
jgi:hypothetical protein